MDYPQGTSEATKRKKEDDSQSDYRSIDSDRDKIRTLSDARTISAKAGPGLRRLTISGEPKEPFTLGMLKAFIVNCPNIEHFGFRYISVQELGMLKLLDDFVAQGDIKIKSVSFLRCDLDDRQDAMFFRHLERATNLEDVSLRFEVDFTGTWLKFFKNLKSIDLEGCISLQPHHFIEFCQRNKTLVKLNIEGCKMNQQCVETIGEELKNLQSITMSFEHFPDSANLSILGDLPKLEELEIYDLNHLVVPLLKRLAFHTKLRALKCQSNIVDSSEGGAEIFRELVKIQGLKSLELDFSRSSEFGDEHLQNSTMDKLEELKIQKTAVTNQGLFDFILKNPSLKTLDISFCRNITDEFFQMIIPRLQTDFKLLKNFFVEGIDLSEENCKILLNENCKILELDCGL